MTIARQTRAPLVLVLFACFALARGERTVRAGDVLAPPNTVEVPSLIGSDPRSAAMACARVGLLFSSIDVETRDHPDGRVFAQSVRAGVAVPRGTTITVRVARAPVVRLVVVPNLVGMTVEDARPAVVGRGLRFELEDVVAPGRPEGLIFAQEPVAGTPVGSGVTVRARRAIRPAATVPSVVGRTLAEASLLLRSAGFYAHVVEVEADQVAAGVVVGQLPQGGASVPARGIGYSEFQVTLQVATRSSVNVPQLVGLSRDEAVAALTRHGLVARIYTRPAPGFPVATVFEQLPVAGVPVRPGATVAFGVVVIVEDALIDMTVPDVRGMFSPQAVAKLRANGYGAKIVEVMTVPPFGIVLSQDPAPGESAAGSAGRDDHAARLGANLGDPDRRRAGPHRADRAACGGGAACGGTRVRRRHPRGSGARSSSRLQPVDRAGDAGPARHGRPLAPQSLTRGADRARGPHPTPGIPSPFEVGFRPCPPPAFRCCSS